MFVNDINLNKKRLGSYIKTNVYMIYSLDHIRVYRIHSTEHFISF